MAATEDAATLTGIVSFLDFFISIGSAYATALAAGLTGIGSLASSMVTAGNGLFSTVTGALEDKSTEKY